jgi:hypothetical protein
VLLILTIHQELSLERAVLTPDDSLSLKLGTGGQHSSLRLDYRAYFLWNRHIRAIWFLWAFSLFVFSTYAVLWVLPKYSDP